MNAILTTNFYDPLRELQKLAGHSVPSTDPYDQFLQNHVNSIVRSFLMIAPDLSTEKLMQIKQRIQQLINEV